MSIFPLIVDTKVLSSAVQDILSSQGVHNFSLETLGNYFDSYVITKYIIYWFSALLALLSYRLLTPK